MRQSLHRGGQLAAVLVGLGLSLAQVRAELPPLDREALKAAATDIVIGDVCKVEASERPARDGLDIVYHLEISIVAGEKGHRWQKGDTLKATCWTIKTRPGSWVGPTGQRFIPRPGERIRAYLDDQELINPNGIEIVIAHQVDRSDSGRQTGQGWRHDSWRSAILAGAVCLAAGFAVGRWCGLKRSKSNVP